MVVLFVISTLLYFNPFFSFCYSQTSTVFSSVVLLVCPQSVDTVREGGSFVCSTDLLVYLFCLSV